MTEQEEILIRLGIDQTSMRAGTMTALDFQKKASMDYVSFWETAMVKKDRTEAALNDKSIARARESAAIKAQIDDAYFAARRAKIEEQNSINAIGNGSGAFGSIKSVESGAIRSGEREAIHDVEAGAAGGATASIVRESMVLVREAFRRNWTRMMGSITLLFQYIGVTAATIVSSIPIVGAAAAAAYGMIKAASGMEDNQATFSIAPLRERLSKEIEQLKKEGRITPDQAQYFGNSLGTISGIRNVQRALGRIPGGIESPEEIRQKEEAAKEVARIKNQAWKEELSAERESMGHWERITSLNEEHVEISKQMVGLSQDSVEYQQKLIEQENISKQIAQEKKDIAKETIDLQKEYDEDKKQINRISGEQSEIDTSDVIPSIEDLAGKSFTDNLKSQYGPAKWERRGRRWVKVGGQFDLQAGDGPFAQAAQQAELAKFQEQWDIEHGNAVWQYNADTHRNELVGGQAFEDRSRRISAENFLSGAGLETPAMKQQKMNQDIADINLKIGILLATAQHDGIVIKTDK